MTPLPAAAVARPRRVRLRPWQSEALDKLAASGGVDFLAVATPGAGKTTFALAAVLQDLADAPHRKIVVVAPTQHLKTQWALAAAGLGLHLDPAWSGGDDLPADMHGIVTTYQQVARSAPALAHLARDAVVVLDEVHHAGDDRTWGTSLLTAFEGASRRLSLSGTPFRSDASPIPFVDYHVGEARPDYVYGYGDALGDGGVVRPVHFPRIDGFMEWVAPDGEVLAATFADDVGREAANQRLRTALSLEGQWLPEVLDTADLRLGEVRRSHPGAGGLVIASDQDHARGIAALLERRHRRGDVVVATSDDPDAGERIATFAAGDTPWIVAVRMVSEGVDIPRLRVAVYATTTTTELFFRQAVGRIVRWVPGVRPQRAWMFVPDDPRLRMHAARVAEDRRHSLARRAERRAAEPAPFDDPAGGDDAEQLSMFAVIGSVALGTDGGEAGTGSGEGPHAGGVGDDLGDDPDLEGPAGVEIVLVPPPLPGGGTGTAVAVGDAGDEEAGAVPMTLARRKQALRDANAELAMELVRATGWGHAQVNRELNRLSGITAVGSATLDQLDRRLGHARAWLRRT